MSYKDFSSFDNITLAFGNPEEDANYGFTASPIVPCKKHDEFDDIFFLIYRRSEYAAQIELACAKIFKMIMGYGPEMEILQDGDKFYIASRKIKDFKEGYPNFENEDNYQNITGIAETRILYYFLCGTDNHSENYGMQKIGLLEKSFRIDMPEAFDFEMLNEHLKLSSLEQIPYIVEKNFEGDNPNYLPQSYVSSTYFQKEKQEIIKRIAETPFSKFEQVLKDTMTVDHYSHLETMMKHMMKYIDLDDSQLQSMQEELLKINPEQHSLSNMIGLLKSRHQRWCQLSAENPVITQDLSLSDPVRFLAELNIYHCNTDSSDCESCDNFDDSDCQEIAAENSSLGFFSNSTEIQQTEDLSAPIKNNSINK